MDERLQRIVDRDEIMEVLLHYTRGADRLDDGLLLSTFHEDAIDHRGAKSVPPREFVASFWPQQATRETCQHYLSNFTIEIDGDTASSESYFLSVNRQVGETTVKLVGGRYVDRLERRDGEWRVAERATISEWSLAGDGFDLGASTSRRDRTDPSYARPLRVSAL